MAYATPSTQSTGDVITAANWNVLINNWLASPNELVTTAGDIVYATAAEVLARLGLGTAGQFLKTNSGATAPEWGEGGTKKTSGGGYFLIPAGPSDGTSISSGAADTYGSWVQMIASTGAAILIVGIAIKASNTTVYQQLELATGAGTSESSIGEIKFGGISTGGADQVEMFPFPIPVAASTRIAMRSADDAGVVNQDYALLCINESDLADI